MNKRILSALVCAALLLGAAGCQSGGGSSSASSAPAGSSSQSGGVSSSAPATGSRPQVDLMVLSGPTGVGAAKLMAQDEAGATRNDYKVTVVTENTEVTAALVKGDADIACIATNVAANLYNKNGGIRVLAANTLGVLYILEKGNSVADMNSLKGKTIYATGQGANPEYVLDHLLTKNGLDPDKDVDIQWMTPQEVTAKMIASADGVCMLPVPAATALQNKDSGVRAALALSDEWDKVSDTGLVMGCVVVREAFLKENPQAVADFMTEYKASIDYMNDPANLDDAAGLVAKYAITANAVIAKKAIPQCNLTFLSGDAMRQAIQGYYAVLHAANPAAIGGVTPDDNFYYAG